MGFDIRFLPDDRVHHADAPVDLFLAAASTGILVEQPCGGQGTCGKCSVRVVRGSVPAGDADREQLTEAAIEDGWRLGCQLVLEGPATLEIPLAARSLAHKSFGGALAPGTIRRPAIEVLSFTLPDSSEDGRALLERIASAAGLPERQVWATPASLAEMAEVSRPGGPFTLVLDESEVVAALPDERRCLGLAFDIGTTSLAAALIELPGGGVRAAASRLNPQVAFGSDVISRIRFTLDHADGLALLASAVRQGLAQLVTELTTEARCDPHDIVAAAVAGNPTMVQAWARVPIESLGVAPYAAAWSRDVSWKAAALELSIHPGANVFVVPMVRSHVGADAVAASIACDLDREHGRRLLIDLGTNSEVLVVSGTRAVATSAAAGPAFEGVSIRCGMRAAPGAIDVVSFGPGGEVVTNTVGGAAPLGLCGSGLIDLAAELLRTGVLSPSGRLRKPGELPGNAARYASRLRSVDGQQAFLLASKEDGAARDIVLTAKDVREIQLAKGSIFTASVMACGRLGIRPDELDEVLVAGAFGSVLRKASVRRIGMLPGVDPQRIRLVGNAAGVGARLALLDADVRDRARRFASRVEYVDLAREPAYQAVFMKALAFPDTCQE